MIELIQQGKISELILTLMIDLLITAAAYLCIPAIFCLVEHNKGTKHDLKKIKKITFINGACIWFVFQLIRYNMGVKGTSFSVILWSWVAYWMMKKVLLEKNNKFKHVNNPQFEPAYNPQFGPSYNPNFEIINKNKKAINFKTPLIIVSILLVLSFAFNLYQLEKQSEMKDDLIQSNEELEEEIAENRNFEKKLQQNREKVDFLDEYIVVVPDNNTYLYHKYDCSRFYGDFWAYNTELAEDLGYEPCPFCCK